MLLLEGPTYGSLLQQAIRALIADGLASAPRGMATKELQHVTLVLNDPRSRHPRVSFRNANIFALHAETLWVLAGRDDLWFIESYLPRMRRYSSDGVTLAGAYGPRIRNWRGVDQLAAVLETLRADQSSRRAVICLFDPARDHDQASLDIPCTNQLHFTVCNGALDLNVYSRSMDIMWGSAINVFEWTTLQESVAYWLGLPIGRYIHSIGSLHIYEEFVPRAMRIAGGVTPARLPTVPFDVPADALGEVLRTFIEIESSFRVGDFGSAQPSSPSMWLAHTVDLNRAYWMATLHKNFSEARTLLSKMPSSADTAMALEQIDRLEYARG